MSRREFTSCFTVERGGAADLAGAAGNNGTTNGPSFDTEGCSSPTVLVHLSAIGGGKKVAFKMQHSDDNVNWADVGDSLASDADGGTSTEMSATGVKKFYYAGDKRYCRIVVVSKAANPAATVRVFHQKHNLYEKPTNRSF